MAAKLVFYVPYSLRHSEEVKKVSKVLDKIKIPKEVKIIEEKEEEELKHGKLISISVLNRIKIRQTKRSKSLYPILVLFDNSKVLTFYPQGRAKDEITIEQFLEGLSDEKVKCLHTLPEKVIDELT